MPVLPPLSTRGDPKAKEAEAGCKACLRGGRPGTCSRSGSACSHSSPALASTGCHKLLCSSHAVPLFGNGVRLGQDVPWTCMTRNARHCISQLHDLCGRCFRNKLDGGYQHENSKPYGRPMKV